MEIMFEVAKTIMVGSKALISKITKKVQFIDFIKIFMQNNMIDNEHKNQ